MKRSGLVRVTVLTVLATVLVQTRTGWFGPRLPRTARKEAVKQARAADPYDSPAAQRWRLGLPAHWRTCLLQH